MHMTTLDLQHGFIWFFVYRYKLLQLAHIITIIIIIITIIIIIIMIIIMITIIIIIL